MLCVITRLGFRMVTAMCCSQKRAAALPRTLKGRRFDPDRSASAQLGKMYTFPVRKVTGAMPF
jgi:hypothetical protein